MFTTLCESATAVPSTKLSVYMMFCATWNHLYNLKNVKNTYGGVLNTPPLAFVTFFKLCKWYQIAQRITYVCFGE